MCYCFYYHLRAPSTSTQAEPVSISSTRKRSRCFNIWKLWRAPSGLFLDLIPSQRYKVLTLTLTSQSDQDTSLLFSLPPLCLMSLTTQDLSCGWYISVGRESTGCQYLLANHYPAPEAWPASNDRKVKSEIRVKVGRWQDTLKSQLWHSQGLPTCIEQTALCILSLISLCDWL